MMDKTAHYISKKESFNNGFSYGSRAAFRLDPPLEGWGGETYEYVVVSRAIPMGEPETYVFPADKDGTITDWGELPGSRRGIYDIEGLLSEMGYRVILPKEESAPAG